MSKMPEDEDKGSSPADGEIGAALRRWGGPIVSAAVSLTIGLINARISPFWAWAALALAAVWTFFALMKFTPIRNLTRRRRNAAAVFTVIVLTLIWWLLVTQVLRPATEPAPTPAEVAAEVAKRLRPMLPATKAQTEEPLSLSVIASLESNARSTDGDFWLIRNAAPMTLIATNRACFLRVINLQDYPIRIDRLNAEALLANGNWEQMRIVSMIGVKDIYYGAAPKKMAHIDLGSLSFEINTDTIPAKGLAEGWIFFDHPSNATSTSSRIRVSVTDDHGNTVWATEAPTMNEGGLRGAPIPVIGFDDLSGYRVKRLPQN